MNILSILSEHYELCRWLVSMYSLFLLFIFLGVEETERYGDQTGEPDSKKGSKPPTSWSKEKKTLPRWLHLTVAGDHLMSSSVGETDWTNGPIFSLTEHGTEGRVDLETKNYLHQQFFIITCYNDQEWQENKVSVNPLLSTFFYCMVNKTKLIDIGLKIFFEIFKNLKLKSSSSENGIFPSHVLSFTIYQLNEQHKV